VHESPSLVGTAQAAPVPPGAVRVPGRVPALEDMAAIRYDRVVAVSPSIVMAWFALM
jgi:hypothetical protein